MSTPRPGPAVALGPLPPDDAPEEVQRDREVWESVAPKSRGGDGLSRAAVAAEFGVTVADVRAAVDREVARQQAAVPAGGGDDEAERDRKLVRSVRRGEDYREAAERLGVTYKELSAAHQRETVRHQRP